LEALMGRRVLVVDDEPMVLEVIASMLDDLGCEVLTASNGADALDRLSSDPHIDILIADISMAEVEGRRLAFRAKQMCSDLNVILLSGRESEGYGFPLIRKPFLQSDLMRVMKATTGLC
jgi:two-component system cell cycle response regulator CpdR